MNDLKELEVSFKDKLNVIQDDNQIKWVHYSFDNMSKHLGNWENHVFHTIKKLLNKDSIFVDVGANIGFHSLRLSKLGFNVVSIEPNTDIYKLLLHNFKINNLDNYKTFNYALSKPNVKLYTEPLPYSFNLGYLPLSEKGSMEVMTTEFDELSIDMSKLGVVKIDVSGGELNVLYGMVNTLNKHRPYVILPLEEQVFNREGYTCKHIVNLMYSLKYVCVEINSDYPCDHLFYPIEKEDVVKELFNIKNKTTNNSINNNLYLGVIKQLNPLEDKQYEFQLLCSWTSSGELCKLWDKMKPKDSKVDMVDRNDAEYTIIVNRPPQDAVYNPSKTMVFRMEPDVEVNEVFNNWYKSKKDFMRFFSNNNYRNNSEWHLDKNYMDLYNTSPHKSRVLSTVLSGLYNMEGHKLRVDFVRYLENNNVDIDIYGRDNDSNFKNYICSLPYHNKNEAILPYKYTFIAENCDLKNYFTEKIIDPILGETLCFYWGCSDLEKYIDSNAFIRLPLEDKEKSMQIVLDAIKNDEWSKRIETIRMEKKKILDYYSFFNRVESYLNLDKNLEIRVVGDFTNDEWVEFSNMAIVNDIKHISREKGETNKDILYIPSTYKFKNGFNDYLSVLYKKLLNEHPDFKEFYINSLDNLNIKEITEVPDTIKIVSNRGNKILSN